MPRPNSRNDIEFSGPATYRIVVQGALTEEWSHRLAGLTVTATARGDAAPHTTLTGPIRDQAELSGVLETLYELHLPILEVERVRDSSRDPNGSSNDDNELEERR